MIDSPPAFVFYCPVLELVQGTSIDPHIIVVLREHQHFSFGAVGGQVNGSRLCEVLVAVLDYLCHTFPFLFSIFSLTFLWSSIDLSSSMMMGWGSVHKETAPQWDNYVENECGEIVFVSLTAITLLMSETDILLYISIFSPYSRDKTQIK